MDAHVVFICRPHQVRRGIKTRVPYRGSIAKARPAEQQTNLLLRHDYYCRAAHTFTHSLTHPLNDVP